MARMYDAGLGDPVTMGDPESRSRVLANCAQIMGEVLEANGITVVRDLPNQAE